MFRRSATSFHIYIKNINKTVTVYLALQPTYHAPKTIFIAQLFHPTNYFSCTSPNADYFEWQPSELLQCLETF